MKFRLLLVIFGLCFGNLFGEIENYFKKITDKSDIHKMLNVDFIYTINLDQRPEKFKNCLEELLPYGISPYRFSAVNGWELSLEAINDLGVKYESWMNSGHWGTCYLPEDGGKPHHEIVHVVGRNYFCHCMARGTIGIVLSHLSIIQDAYDSGYETVWIMEDDIQIIKNPHLISQLIDKLDATVGRDNWDMLFTDQDTKNRKGEYVSCRSFAWRPNFSPRNVARFGRVKKISRDFKKIGARYGAYSYILRRAGMEKILNHFKTNKIFLPFDMEFYLPSDVAIYTVTDDVVSTFCQALSDNGAPNYLNK